MASSKKSDDTIIKALEKRLERIEKRMLKSAQEAAHFERLQTMLNQMTMGMALILGVECEEMPASPGSDVKDSLLILKIDERIPSLNDLYAAIKDRKETPGTIQQRSNEVIENVVSAIETATSDEDPMIQQIAVGLGQLQTFFLRNPMSPEGLIDLAWVIESRTPSYGRLGEFMVLMREVTDEYLNSTPDNEQGLGGDLDADTM